MSLIPGASGVAASFPDGFTVSNGTVTAPGYKFSDSQTGFYRPGTNEWALASNGVQSLLVSSGGAFTFGPSGGASHIVLTPTSGTSSVTAHSGIMIGNNSGGNQAPTIFARQTNGTVNQQALGLVAQVQVDSAAGTPAMTFGVGNQNYTAGVTNRNLFSWNNFGTEVGKVSAAGAWTVGPTPDTSVFHTLNIGTSGLGGAPIISAQASGSIIFKNATGTSNASPQMQMKTSSTNQSNYITAGAHDTNNSGDLYFISANQAGGTFSTLTNKAFVWGADSELGSVTRGGAWTFGTGSTPATRTADASPLAGYAHLIQGATTATDQSILQIADNSGGGSEARAVLMLRKNSGTTSSAQRYMYFSPGGGVGNGMITGNGANNAAFGSYSDARLKTNVENIPEQLSQICALRPVEFDYTDGSGHQIGFIAQEIESIYPDCVSTESDGAQYKVVSGWSKTEARLVKAIQELKAELDEAKAEIEILKGVN
jgi:hypothetical protein